MSKSEESILVLCDGEEDYVHLLSEFLKRQEALPWNIRTYSRMDRLMEVEQEEIDLLVVAESMYEESLRRQNAKRLVILNESGMIRDAQVHNVNKYQPAENVLKELLEIYLEIAKNTLPSLKNKSGTKFIGIYSPVRRCMQTRFALTMGELLAKRAKVLYLNFEHYAGDRELLEMDQARDLADILYFMMANKEKFALHMQIVLRHKGSLDYIPPMKSGQNLLTVTEEEWIDFMKKLDELGSYDYILMDLCDSMQGLFHILRQCTRVYTITQKDRIAKSKVMQYEQLLQAYAYQDILDKTCKCSLPRIESFPEYIEQYTTGILADYVETLIEDL